MTDRIHLGAAVPARRERPGRARARLQGGLILALAAGLGLVTVLVAVVGRHEVARAAAAVGWGGFAIFCIYWLGVMATAGLAWATAAHRARGRALAFVWARFLRDSAAPL